MEPLVIIGIDPGLAHTGWGVVHCSGSKLAPVAYGCITTTKADELPSRLAAIHDQLCAVIDRYEPAALAAEGVYFGHNAKSAMLTAQARGAALVACAYKGLEYGEYTPMQIKQTLVGTGTAAKEQVQYMVRAVLQLDDEPKPDHAADALAAAITHARLRCVARRERDVDACCGWEQRADVPSAQETVANFERCVRASLAKEASR